mmetsp:Transcript_16329/g.46611  ORF Transcript_16329/g.46611 Transcript_16329/m.46611 type:complete len:204 (+) Transcript_16329:484-1095(+)
MGVRDDVWAGGAVGPGAAGGGGAGVVTAAAASCVVPGAAVQFAAARPQAEQAGQARSTESRATLQGSPCKKNWCSAAYCIRAPQLADCCWAEHTAWHPCEGGAASGPAALPAPSGADPLAPSGDLPGSSAVCRLMKSRTLSPSWKLLFPGHTLTPTRPAHARKRATMKVTQHFLASTLGCGSQPLLSKFPTPSPTQLYFCTAS